MRIGIDIRSLMDKEYSGVSLYTLDLLRSILKQDRNNEYILYYNSAKDISARMPKLEYPNVSMIRTSYPNKLFNYFLQKIFAWPKLDKILGGVDIFFSPHINFTSLSKKTKHILTIHDLSFLRYPEFFSFRKNFWHRSLGLKKAAKRADLIVAVSESTKKDVVELLEIDPEKTKVIHSGLDGRYRPIPKNDERLAIIKKKYSLPKKFILSLGTIEPRKNISGLIKAFDRALQFPELKDHYLLIAGRKGWKNKDVFRTFESIKHKDRVIFLGYIDEDAKPYLYNAASIFIYPSFYEGFGFPPLEAMACGTPVIAAGNSSLTEACSDSALLVEADNVESLAQGLRHLEIDKDLRDNLINKGFIQAGKFDWEDTAKKYINLFL
ncbi:glycosyltransferase [Candidatus Falkowbacteria bacterium]|nr:glycosyltransferase [Candidatus Falkowbacteria bacterium]